MVDSGNLRLALLSAAVLGFRHGLDYDHISAITDITSVQAKARDAMRYGLFYVTGHATTVVVFGAIAVGFRVSLPVCEIKKRPGLDFESRDARTASPETAHHLSYRQSCLLRIPLLCHPGSARR